MTNRQCMEKSIGAYYGKSREWTARRHEDESLLHRREAIQSQSCAAKRVSYKSARSLSGSAANLSGKREDVHDLSAKATSWRRFWNRRSPSCPAHVYLMLGSSSKRLVRKKTPYPKRKGKTGLYEGWLPIRVLEDGSLDIHYVPSLRALLKMEGKFVVELARVKEEPHENFAGEESRAAQIRAREGNLQAIRTLIKKRREMER